MARSLILVTRLVGHRTCDLQVSCSIPGWAPLRSGLEQATYTCVPLSPSSIIWYRPREVVSLAGKVTADLLESNGSLPPGNDKCQLRADCQETVMSSVPNTCNRVCDYFTSSNGLITPQTRQFCLVSTQFQRVLSCLRRRCEHNCRQDMTVSSGLQ